MLLTTPLLGGCGDRYSTLPVPGVPATEMPVLDQSITSSSLEQARRGMGNHTWFWTRGGGPAQIHYSTADGRDFVWLVGERRILAGQWRVESNTSANGQVMTQICLRYPGVRRQDLSDSWLCRPAGTMFMEMQEREGGDPLRFSGRTQAKFVLTATPANLAEVEGRVAATPENLGY
ncbi:MAG: hypothetical protein EXR12_05325 [Rhodospirillaceae bacterium]|nr:hypothetical protein [Rhodospirillaceae bacterium]